MANKSFVIFKVPDKDLIQSFEKITEECGLQNANLTLHLAQQHRPALTLQLSQIGENETIQKLLSIDSAVFFSVQISFPDLNFSIVIKREDHTDTATLNFPDDIDAEKIYPLISSCYKHLQTYERTESIDKLLGDELAEFYRRREQGLLRLEDLAQKLIEQNEEYRRKLDNDTDTLRDEIKSDDNMERQKLHKDFEEKEANFKAREAELDERVEALDDRTSKHARRQLRQDLKQVIEDRNKEFTLTKKTTNKRIVNHTLFCLLIVSIGTLVMQAFAKNYDATSIYGMLRLTLSAAALVAAIIYYIRWNDKWFRQHADEEFRLKRLELDIDRASWVVEMALEWKGEKGTDLPSDLIYLLSRNLFVDSNDSETVKHPSEDLASALLSASSGLKVNVPGFGEASLDRRAIKNFKKDTTSKREDTV